MQHADAPDRDGRTMQTLSRYVVSKSRTAFRQGNMLNTKLKDAYYRWRHGENRWERRGISIQDQVGGEREWEEVGELGFEFLKEMGLRPQSTLIDVGCGSFRIGRHLINYLEKGCYTGIDGSRYLLDEGSRQILAKECDLERKQPIIRHAFITNEVVDLYSIFGRKYDFIWVHAIFDHIPPARIKIFLQSLITVMHPKSRIYATFFLNPFGEEYREPIKRLRYGKDEGSILTLPDREYWHHTTDFYKTMCDDVGGLRYSRYYDYNYPIEGLKIAELETASQ
jgi:SAM-dependent methyltransferase